METRKEKLQKEKLYRQFEIYQRLSLIGAVIAVIVVIITFIILLTSDFDSVSASETQKTLTIGAFADMNEIAFSDAVLESEEEEKEEIVKKRIYSEYDVDLLARVLFCENGADYTTDDLLYKTGAVVLNRVDSDIYPNDLESVVYQKGQYACTTWLYKNDPPERCYRISRDLLENGQNEYLSSSYLFQAEFEQGDGGFWQEGTYFGYLD